MKLPIGTFAFQVSDLEYIITPSRKFATFTLTLKVGTSKGNHGIYINDCMVQRNATGALVINLPQTRGNNKYYRFNIGGFHENTYKTLQAFFEEKCGDKLPTPADHKSTRRKKKLIESLVPTDAWNPVLIDGGIDIKELEKKAKDFRG